MTPRFLRVLVAAVALLPLPGVAEARAAGRFQVLEIVRVRPGGPAELTVSITFATDDARGFMGLFGVAKRHGRNALGYSSTVEHGAPGPAVYGPGTPPVTAAPLTMMSGDTYATKFPATTTMRLFVVSESASVDVAVDEPHWTVRRARLGVRRLVARQAGTGVDTPAYGVEQFDGRVSLPGGPYGSIAWGAIPCAGMPYDDPVFGAGAGSAVLGGGAAPLTLSCDENSRITSHPKRTTWYLSGSVRGLSDKITRLMVVDFPR